MNNTTKRFIIFAILVCVVGFSVYAQEKQVVDHFTMPSARHAGMGGMHITNLDGAGALLNNPAGLVGKKEFGILEISPSLTAPIDKYADIMDSVSKLTGGDIEEGEELDAVQDLLNVFADDEGNVKPYVGLTLGAPLSLSIVSKGFGFGLFTGAAANASFIGGTAKINADVNAQAVFAYGHRFINTRKHTLDVGLGVNAFYRLHTEKSLGLNDVADLMGDGDDKPEFKDIIPLQGIFGIGLDAGIQYGFNNRLAVAIAANNLLSYARIMDMSDDFLDNENPVADTNGSSYRGLNVGVHYQLIKSWGLNLTFLADYRDILDLFSDIPRNPILNLGLGAELGLLDDHISIRAGISDMLPSLGLGFDLFAFKLNVAAYGKELGLDPGVQSVFCLDIGLLFRW
jgi:hypothetical protein